MRSNPAHQLCLIFQLETFLRSDLNLSTSYGRSTDLESLSGLFFVSFIWLGVKISLKSLLPGGTFVLPHALTVSRSLMFKLIKFIFRITYFSNSILFDDYFEP